MRSGRLTIGVEVLPWTAASASSCDGARCPQHEVVLEVDRELVAVVSVGDGAGLVGDDAAVDRAWGDEVVGWPRPLTAGRQAVLREDRRGRSLYEQCASLPDEGRQLEEAFEAHASSNVVALVDAAQVGVCSAVRW